MDDRRVGRLLRSVRQHLGLRQIDVARNAGVSQKVVSDLELGRLESVGLARTRRVAAVLDISIGIDAWWRAGQADRLLDRAHASLVDYVVGVLGRAGWQIVPEFTFNHYGERGSVDILAWHAGERILLIVEIKATLTDLQDTFASLSKKARVVPRIAAAELNWRFDHVARHPRRRRIRWQPHSGDPALGDVRRGVPDAVPWGSRLGPEAARGHRGALARFYQCPGHC